jgi:hypothetical protein
MGLFSAHRRLRPSGFRWPVRLHSELSVAALARRFKASLRRLVPRLRELAVAATNDARIVGAVLLVAAGALAFEMAASFR